MGHPRKLGCRIFFLFDRLWMGLSLRGVLEEDLTENLVEFAS